MLTALTPVLLNFAYGSNMLSRRLRARVPNARAIGVGRLDGYQLHWHKLSVDKSGKCDICPSSRPGAVVWGVLYEIPVIEKVALDEAEGLGQGYAEKKVDIETSTGVVTAVAYYATKTDPNLMPHTWYKAFVIAGAREHGLPPEYIEKLEHVEAKLDSNENRSRKNFGLLDAEK